jgi:hypothetical protein
MKSCAKTAALAVGFWLAAHAASANAGGCAGEIAGLEQSLRENPGAIGTARQSIGAQLEHQPTPASVESAKNNAKAEIVAILAEARALDAQGRQDACAEAVARAKILLNP